MDDKLWYLKRSDLFEQLSADEITRIESRSRVQTFPRKGLVYLPSDSSDAVFLLTKGRIKLYNVTADGKETVLAFIEPGEVFGELSLLNPGQREEFAEAMAASNVVMIPCEVIRELMEIRPALTIQITKLMGLRRQRIERRLKSLLFRSNRERLIYLLLELAARYGERAEDGIALGIRLSHQELSSVIGSTRETVTVLRGELQLEQSLIIKRRQIILTNLRQLASSLDEVPPEVEKLIEVSSGEGRFVRTGPALRCNLNSASACDHTQQSEHSDLLSEVLMRTVLRGLTVAILGLSLIAPASAEKPLLRVGTFDVDASPPIGSPLAYDPTKEITTPLSCRGIVIAGAGRPIVLCAVDWIGIANEGQEAFINRIAASVDTRRERVVVHTLHQHDASRCDFSVDELLREYDLNGTGFDPGFAYDVARAAAIAAKKAPDEAQPVTHVGIGAGIVEKVASNRRILGKDGKVIHVRYTATRDPKIRAFPAGTIDPELKMLSLWNGDKPLVALSWYATHPQSYYRTGGANPDSLGLAQKATGIPHVHFNGAGGNIGAGKWNDGSHENRQILADRVAAGMKKAWDSTKNCCLKITSSLRRIAASHFGKQP